VRAPKDWPIARPGDLVEFDTLDVRQLSTLVLKQFTAWGPGQPLGRRGARPPSHGHGRGGGPRCPGGAEFMAEFEQACATRGIRLFVLPPRSPKLHGTVERANRTHTAEFYELTDAETGLASLQAALRDWETVYNTVRPHQSLGYLTPAEYLASLGIDV
jgi:putative transposase